jgi:hypothetical protein
MSEKIKEIASRAPPVPSFLHAVLEILNKRVKAPLEGTIFDRWVAEPAKKLYISAKRLE